MYFFLMSRAIWPCFFLFNMKMVAIRYFIPQKCLITVNKVCILKQFNKDCDEKDPFSFLFMLLPYPLTNLVFSYKLKIRPNSLGT
jgi:hypothetical protein